MFLNELNKKEANAFINLVEALANVDNVFAKNEKDLIDDYIQELELDEKNIKKIDFETSVKEFEKAEEKIKNIIYFELVGLALCDGEYDEKEIQFLKGLAARFNISKNKQYEFINYFKTVKEIYDNTVVDYEGKIELLKKSAMELI
ncbi:TerB family tellurite resistance protein [Clostridiaceae bacterium UIB06]|uniref:TerB family tellurite resistance protein n=1 Tax=Clostridium thailandense TaxID=2794346 RepID=A0A949WQE8_9CLOT|nr:TerB family tellurite resistance protein [Clostridium thailandense]MBV7272676.1 TerB family tellurite resistance protein [Clostridium thailandense]MCH5137876.1 TerB family tellurite resistance protein [Clostridiaceae bacterium UIB06]